MHVSSTYRPQNQLLPQGNLAATAPYTFSAKEKDSETNLSYFGARYYSSDLSIWLSMDPMAAKYPSLSPYVYCADNPIKLVDPNGEELTDDIVIHGKNNSSITIKTELVDWNFDVDLDFRGNYEVNPDNVAIGYEYGVDASGRAGVGTSYNAYKQSVMFLGGSYAGYWYDYIGGEAQVDASLSAAGNIGVHKNMFIAINNNPATYNPKDFAGEYSGASLSLSWRALAGISVDGQFATSKDGTWNVISLGLSGARADSRHRTFPELPAPARPPIKERSARTEPTPRHGDGGTGNERGWS